MRPPPRPVYRTYAAAAMVAWPDHDLMRHAELRQQFEGEGMTRSEAGVEAYDAVKRERRARMGKGGRWREHRAPSRRNRWSGR